MEELYKQNSRIVYHFLYTLCKDADLAEELTQETFLRAIESLERYDGSCKISTWLCQIARHILYQYWARHGKERLVELDDLLIAREDTERQAMNQVELEDVWDRLQKLPEAMRQVVTLRVLSDLSFRQIGDMLGKSENWARVTFYRAKMILLKEVQYDENEL
ncbi:MAG: sigma-70 family RNA polymerase sigma factor [Lachnospiraceae bacterium]|nr:sigma-70 family RNA polymerase sigma factor [Lachnospiraceae bacterium]